MSDRKIILIHIRRISALIDNAIRNGPDGTLEGKYGDEHPQFINHILGFYLIGLLAYLAGEDGEYSWNEAGNNYSTFNEFSENYPMPPKVSYQARGITQSSLDALAHIRNAIAHNNGDLSENRNPQRSIAIVSSAQIPGVKLNGTTVSLEPAFLEFVRVAAYAVRNYHGET